jgi:subtilisin family serine protease
MKVEQGHLGSESMTGHNKRGLLLATSLLTLAVAAIPQAAIAQAAPTPTPTPAPSPTPTPSTTESANPIRPYRGDIRSFWGDIRSFRGDIRSFWGDIRSFWGDIRSFGNSNNPYDGTANLTFWGDLSAYNGPVTANAPAWSAVGDFWTTNGATLNTIGDSWNGLGTYGTANSAQYATVAQQLKTLLDGSSATWGSSVAAATGKTFDKGFVAPLLAKYNIDLSKPATLAGIDPGQFLFAYYDGLMGYSGRAHVDHWMKEIDYTPSMTQQIGDGARATIGVLDMAVSQDSTSNLTSFNPKSTFTTGHGDAVASLLVADPANLGVMGMAPMASVVTYNPFDSTGTAGWADIQKGVIALSNAGAGVVNASLGVPGWTLNEGWNQVFSDPTVAAATKNTIFVIAAGNEGVTQTQNILWNRATNPDFIVVGSANTAGTISSFSNRPGNACLSATDVNKACPNGSKLMNYFITAPGEMMLVSDGAGGLTRMSGTSFAAPLVSGTIALLQDRWPWLANYPAETVGIILRTARPISDGTPGAPALGPTNDLPLGEKAGVNATYGVGELDVGAALSPIDFNKVKFYTYVDGKIVSTDAGKLRDPKQQAKWNAAGMYFYAYEDVGQTFRDFAIPMDANLLNQTTMSSFTGSMQQFQYYVMSRLQTWMGAGNTLPATKLTGLQFSSTMPTSLGFGMSFATAPKQQLAGFRQSNTPYQMAVRLTDPEQRFALTAGSGDGALAMSERAGTASASDYDPYVGGANPVLGFASGGAYGEVKAALTDHLSVSTGITQRELRRDFRGPIALDYTQFLGLRPYRADAAKVAMSYDLGRARVTGTYTRLREHGAVLGEQSVNPFDMMQGSTTQGATVEANFAITPTWTLDATGTASRTSALGAQNYRTSDGGLRAMSWQFGMSKDHLLDRSDAIRLTLAQPLHIERGGFDYAFVKVIDRQTGQLGQVVQHVDLGNRVKRELVGEAIYAHDVLGGAAQLRLFGRANLKREAGSDGGASQTPAVMGGGGFRLTF